MRLALLAEGGIKARGGRGPSKKETKGTARLSTTKRGGIHVETIIDPDVFDFSGHPVALPGMR
jgi:hypothetical protein